MTGAGTLIRTGRLVRLARRPTTWWAGHCSSRSRTGAPVDNGCQALRTRVRSRPSSRCYRSHDTARRVVPDNIATSNDSFTDNLVVKFRLVSQLWLLPLEA